LLFAGNFIGFFPWGLNHFLMSEEFFDVVDEKDRVVGRASREEVHRLGLFHRAVHIWIFDHNGYLLLQKRALIKDRHPGAWDCSCSGHVGAGESYEDAALRELSEELGVTVEVTELELIEHAAACAQTDQEFIRVYRMEHDGPFAPDLQEISEIRWWRPADVLMAITAGTEKFATAFSNIAPKHLLALL
jgi:isopentenyl-diphosphate delta-isomerase type 1